MKQYRVLKATVIEGVARAEGEVLRNLTEEDAKPYLKSKVVAEEKSSTHGEGEGDRFDVAPSAKPNMATSLKQIVSEESDEKNDDKAAPKAAAN